MNIELGCGAFKNTGFIGIDRQKKKGVDIVHDLEKGIPLEDNTVDLVSASHILEHISNLMFLMDEIWRVCRPGAGVAISVPHYQSLGAWCDPTHVRAFTEATFYYWDPQSYLYSLYKPKAQFHIESLYWSPMGNIETVLRVIKGKYKGEDVTAEEAITSECTKEKKMGKCGKKKKGK